MILQISLKFSEGLIKVGHTNDDNYYKGQAVIFPRGHTDIFRRKYWNLTGNSDNSGHRKDQLLKSNFFLTHIIIIYCLKYDYLNAKTVLLILDVLNAQNCRYSHKKFVYVIARPQETKKKISPCIILPRCFPGETGVMSISLSPLLNIQDGHFDTV